MEFTSLEEEVIFDGCPAVAKCFDAGASAICER